ncbi:uncharacterized protein [Spinacia oleracea]|uniref:CCHC-type domain-containing protein n=1 Tax=Spinacia oleracea TaxID=3562 RepID=A0A9R0HWD7_SPIOL|nr:uncharacterized protein LOC110777884 [Spinacia oleracea]
MGLMRRLKKKWSIKGELSLTDIGCRYFVARFTNSSNYNFVLSQGPWMLDDNYLTIRKWVPNFVPDEESIKVLTTWVRIPNLSVEYFDINFLNRIGSKIGKVLRVDRSTAQADRGKFTRLSIEIDLTKPLLSKFWLNGKIWKIQYEGIRMICFKCGTMGHNEEECSTFKQPEAPQDNLVTITNQLMHSSVQDDSIHKAPEEEEDFGSWMLVKKPVRKRVTKQDRGGQNTGKGNSNGATGTGKSGPHKERYGEPNQHAINGVNHGIGSRFSLLANQLNMEGEILGEENTESNTNKDTDSVIGSPNIFTVNLGDNSQNKGNQEDYGQSFSLGSKSRPTENPSTTKTASKVTNTHQGKENSPIIFEATRSQYINAHNCTEKPPQSVGEPSQDVIVVQSPRGDQVENPTRENLICGSPNGETVFLHSEPPDPHSRDPDRLMVGTNLDAAGVGVHTPPPQRDSEIAQAH